MLEYIKQIIPRIKKFSSKLDRIELFVDRTWTFIDFGKITTYRFKRNQRVIISIEGEFEEHEWELIGTDGLLIRKPGALVGKSFRHGFIFDGLLILQKESQISDPIILYNPELVKDGDVLSYLKNVLPAKMELKRLAKTRYYIPLKSILDTGTPIYDENFEMVYNDSIQLPNGTVIIRRGLITDVISQKKLKTTLGNITVYVRGGDSISIGDPVSADWDIQDGSYKILYSDQVSKLKLRNRKIVSLSTTTEAQIKVVLYIFAIAFFIILFYYIIKSYQEL